MNKDELRNHLFETGLINHPNEDSKEWQRAFELAEQHGMGRLSMDCNKCWTKVIEWIKK